MVLLVTGSHGQLGRSVLAAAGERGLPAVGHDVDTFDITDPRAVHDMVQTVTPRAVINCAAFTAVDDCEAHEQEAARINGAAVGFLASSCTRVGALLAHVSTDYVFDGSSRQPYTEDSPVAPASAYGRSKLTGERCAMTAPDHLVIRTAWLYGRGGRNFIEAIRAQIEGGAEELRVVSDQHGCPTLSDDLADAVLDLIESDARGVFHAVNSGATTWHGFAVEIARQLGADVRVHPVTTGEFPRPAPRPAYSVLSTARLERRLGRGMPPWQDALSRYLEPPCAS